MSGVVSTLYSIFAQYLLGFRNWIHTPHAPRMAAANAFRPKPSPAHQTKFFDGLIRVFRTGWMEFAGRRQHMTQRTMIR